MLILEVKKSTLWSSITKKEAKVIRISWQCLNAQIYSFDHLFWICCSTINLKTYWRFTSHFPNMHSLNREGCLKHAFAGALMETRLINGWAYWTWENCTIGRDRSMDKVVAHQELKQQWSDKSWLIVMNLNINLRQLVWSWLFIKNCNNYLRQFDCSSRVAETIVRDSLVVWFSSRIATIIIDIIKNFNSNLR